MLWVPHKHSQVVGISAADLASFHMPWQNYFIELLILLEKNLTKVNLCQVSIDWILSRRKISPEKG